MRNWTALASGYDISSIHVDADGANVEELECTSERDARIRPRARILWEETGVPVGRDIQFWEQAVRETDTEHLPACEMTTTGICSEAIPCEPVPTSGSVTVRPSAANRSTLIADSRAGGAPGYCLPLRSMR
ncbi:DUF2934 domain-containing protein [Paraburkholderia fungorum]|jgi:hypothetical protein|uniref:DUF2934 domain-containing protein n=1 Tax=Paraburkholderia fungorum TaxID=134537 RepID=UPI0038BBFA8B